MAYATPTSLERWRLILGAEVEDKGEVSLGPRQKAMDSALEALYGAERRGDLSKSSLHVHRWLGDIRRYFPAPVVQLLQRDALERLGLAQMLSEPELLTSLEPNVHLAATLISLHQVMPEQTRHTARQVVRHITRELEQRLSRPLCEAVVRAAHRSNHRTRRPRPRDIDWHRTVYQNLRHYQPTLRAVIPERRYGYLRRSKALRHVVLAVDQSGSMTDSFVYAAVFGAVMASVPSLKTQLFAFDTEIADLSAFLHDPVEILFGAQLGGGTDLTKALGYAQRLIVDPENTIVVLISDLYEGGSSVEMLKVAHHLRRWGVLLIVLLALSDEGAPAYDRQNAAALAAMDIPVFACSPQHFPEVMAAAINRTYPEYGSTGTV
jgi:Mg-chelatase subunit ChlD